MDKSKEEKEEERVKEAWIAGIGILALVTVLLFGGTLANLKNETLHNAAPYVLWAGIALMVYFLFLFFANLRIVKVLGGEYATGAALSLVLGALLLEGSVEASGALNKVFGVDASAFPSALHLMTFICTFVLIKPVYVALLSWSCISIVYHMFFADPPKNDTALKALLRVIAAFAGAFVGLILVLTIYFKFNTDALDTKAYLLARALDFNDKLNCPDYSGNGAGVFLGSSQNRVLIDKSTPRPINWYAVVYANADSLSDITVPQTFAIRHCGEGPERAAADSH